MRYLGENGEVFRISPKGEASVRFPNSNQYVPVESATTELPASVPAEHYDPEAAIRQAQEAVDKALGEQ